MLWIREIYNYMYKNAGSDYMSWSGFVGKIVEHPFDTVKVRLQAQQHGTGQSLLAYFNHFVVLVYACYMWWMLGLVLLL